jgi:hypothetical protein
MFAKVAYRVSVQVTIFSSWETTMMPATTERAEKNTSPCVNEQIREMTRRNVVCSAAGGSEAIDRRLAELDREWDIERALEAHAAIASLVAVTLGVMGRRKWFVFPAVVGGFLLKHAIYDSGSV